MATTNQYASTPDKAQIWELGYLAGWQEPEVDHTLPYAPDLLDVYTEGEEAGRTDRRQLPVSTSTTDGTSDSQTTASGGDDQGSKDDSGDDGTLDTVLEVAKTVGIHVIGDRLGEIFDFAGGIYAIAFEALSMESDTPVHAMPSDYEQIANQPGDHYTAMCPRTDHDPSVIGYGDDGVWVGTPHTTFQDADADRKAHGHAECAVALYSSANGTCGLVSATN